MNLLKNSRKNKLLFILLISCNVFSLNIKFSTISEIAIKNNKDFYLKQQKLKLQEVNFFDYINIYLPAFNISYNNNFIYKINSSDTEEYSIRIQASQLIFDGNKQLTAIKLNKLKKTIENIKFKNEIKYFKFKIINEYLKLLLLKEELKIQFDYKNILDKQLAIAKKELELGIIKDVDYLGVYSKLKQAEIDLMGKKENFSNAIIRFKYSVNFNEDINIEIKENLENSFILNKPVLNKYKLYEIYKKNNTSLKQILLNKKEKEIKYKYFKTSYIPNISVKYYFSLSDDRFIPRKKDFGFNITLDFSLLGSKISESGGYDNNIYNREKTIQNNGQTELSFKNSYFKTLKLLSIDYNLNKYQLKRKLRQIKENFFMALNKLNLTYNKLQVYKIKLGIDKKKLELMKRRVNIGEIKRLDYLKDILEYVNFQKSYYSQLVDYMNFVYTIENSLGKEQGYLNLIRIKNE